MQVNWNTLTRQPIIAPNLHGIGIWNMKPRILLTASNRSDTHYCLTKPEIQINKIHKWRFLRRSIELLVNWLFSTIRPYSLMTWLGHLHSLIALFFVRKLFLTKGLLRTFSFYFFIMPFIMYTWFYYKIFF